MSSNLYLEKIVKASPHLVSFYQATVVLKNSKNAYETDFVTYSNSFNWICIHVKDIKTNVKKKILDLENV